MSSLRDALADYLRVRRRLGFEMLQDGRLLEGFVEFLERAGAERATTELALKWARMPAGAHPHTWRQRLSVARGFARHLATIDPASEVLSKDLLPGHRPRIAPYIYTDGEIAALIAAAGRLTPPLRAARHQTVIGLLAVTGMRPGEALALDRRDVDLRHGVVHVRAGKQKKQREVPLHNSTIRALREYARQRDARFPEPSTPAFFISARARRMGRGELNQTFTKLIREVGQGMPEIVRAGPGGGAAAVQTPCARSLTGMRPARTSTGGCRCSARIWGTWTRPAHTGIWRRSPSCLS
jgi:integrase/recombinase XerD